MQPGIYKTSDIQMQEMILLAGSLCAFKSFIAFTQLHQALHLNYTAYSWLHQAVLIALQGANGCCWQGPQQCNWTACSVQHLCQTVAPGCYGAEPTKFSCPNVDTHTKIGQASGRATAGQSWLKHIISMLSVCHTWLCHSAPGGQGLG